VRVVGSAAAAKPEHGAIKVKVSFGGGVGFGVRRFGVAASVLPFSVASNPGGILRLRESRELVIRFGVWLLLARDQPSTLNTVFGGRSSHRGRSGSFPL